MFEAVQKAVESFKEFKRKDVQIVSHSDADGVCAAAILSIFLDREGIDHSIKFVKISDRESLEEIPQTEVMIFTDIGSSMLEVIEKEFAGSRCIILDHHEPDNIENHNRAIYLNAHLLGIDGGFEISGAGMAFLFAYSFDRKNADLSRLAIIGALGDAQNLWGGLIGVNREIAEIAIRLGVLQMDVDLLLYGRHSRPIYKALAGFVDPFIPGISNSPYGSLHLLRELGIPVKENDKIRKPIDLNLDEKCLLASEMIIRASINAPEELTPYVPRLIVGETFSLPLEQDESGLKDVDEFATSLNAVAKQEHPEIGLEIAKGDRVNYYSNMKKLLARYRKNIAKILDRLEEERVSSDGPSKYLQVVDLPEYIRETMVGTVVGMMMSSGWADPYRPIIGIVRKNGMAKISARCSRLLTLQKINLSKAIRDASRKVGGRGGGHATASGAIVEENMVAEFTKIFEKNLLMQRQI